MYIKGAGSLDDTRDSTPTQTSHTPSLYKYVYWTELILPSWWILSVYFRCHGLRMQTVESIRNEFARNVRHLLSQKKTPKRSYNISMEHDRQ